MTKEQLKKIAIYASNKNIDIYTPILNKYMQEYNIVGLKRQSMFLATIIHESGSFRYTRELASGAAYEGRKDLGNTQEGDGTRFRGRGLIQITGRYWYTEASKDLGLDLLNHPELLETPENAVLVSCWWWKRNNMNSLCDTSDLKTKVTKEIKGEKITVDPVFLKVTKKVNGGYNGIKDRIIWFDLALKNLGE